MRVTSRKSGAGTGKITDNPLAPIVDRYVVPINARMHRKKQAMSRLGLPL